MGKKTPKRKDANSSTSSYFEQNSKDSSCSSINVSNRSIDEGSTVPDKLLVVSVESAGCSMCMYIARWFPLISFVCLYKYF